MIPLPASVHCARELLEQVKYLIDKLQTELFIHFRASFHPLTNRKHHCRLCGQIICSLPIKRPHRPATCSLLFVVDPKTKMIEEVNEGVDYGVRRRRVGSVGADTGQGTAAGQEEGEEDKFLRGVRICRQCRPVLL